jgi:hypothetical protein
VTETEDLFIDTRGSHQRITPRRHIERDQGIQSRRNSDESCSQLARGTPQPRVCVDSRRAWQTKPNTLFAVCAHFKIQLGGLVLIFVLDKKAEDANLLRIARSGKLSTLKVDVAGEI